MVEYINSLIADTTINPSTVVLKLTISLILGLTIGAERQMRRRDAGLRTFTLICMGSTGAMLLSIWIPQIYPNFLNGDPGRIAAQVITGIGFLGAGAIVRGKGSVQGLTTAASIWQAAVIGMAVGAGLYWGAFLATFFTLFVLIAIEKFEQRLFIDGANRILTIHCSKSDPEIERIKAVVESCRITVSSYTFSVNYTNNESTITFKVTLKGQSANQQGMCKELHTIDYITAISVVS
ncbi:MAG: MgtC/SapB family protein [Marinilabiliaceae bacterium]|nr:MgtC/SapB family protein [Marinilabiliaceae bacterium]